MEDHRSRAVGPSRGLFQGAARARELSCQSSQYFHRRGGGGSLQRPEAFFLPDDLRSLKALK